MRVDASNNIHPGLFDGLNFESYYTTWQLLLAAEVAGAGIHLRMNLAERNIGQIVDDLNEGKAPDARYSLELLPVHAARAFAKHEKAPDAVVWFAEERGRALDIILKDQGGGRFRMTDAQSAQYDQATDIAASAAMRRYEIGWMT